MQVIESQGARIPVIGLGTMTLHDDVCIELVEAALHLGYRHLDTAQMYGNEREVGSGLRGSGVKREDVFVTTKVWFNRLAAGDFERSVDESLARLALPWVDLLMIHWPNAQIPLAETIGAASLRAESGLEVPTGPLTLAPVRRDERLRLSRAGAGWTLSGTATRVPWGRAAKHVVVVADVDSRAHVALVAAGGYRVTADRNLALEPRDTLVFDGAQVGAAAPAAARIPDDAIWLYGALARSAQMAGGLEQAVGQATRYVTERRQFGKPIGAFQAIQWQLAILGEQTAAAGTAAANAFRAADRGDPAFEIAVAKVRVGEAAGIGASIAHQVHGAIGFTYEHALQFTTRRLWSWRAEFGGEGDWAGALGRSVAGRGADALWPFLTAR